ncbi:hypothetical protein LTR04_003931 [Oleoguttula sp. CCFEE 6159]|nr:hypothetical protein LTR04_003931 [Oleoguttula sp. CCFEE 6159]
MGADAKGTMEHLDMVSLDGDVKLNIKGVDETTRTHYLEFSAKDAEWRAFHNKKLVRKIDLRLMPLLVLMYLLNFLDRSNLAQARLGTLEKDLKMKATDFNLATSILFVGYLLMQLPSNMLITRLRPSLYLGLAMATWGLVSACHATVTSFQGLVVVRFFLGFVEAPFFPGAVFLMSCWYTRAELTKRISWLYSGNALANMFGGLLGAGILGNLSGAHGIAGWRWLFIIEGTITFGVALFAAFILPDFPATTKWLTEEERYFAAWRLLEDINEADEIKSTSVWTGAKLAFADWRLYLFILLQHMSLLSQTFQYFFPSIVGTLGYGKIQTLLLTVQTGQYPKSAAPQYVPGGSANAVICMGVGAMAIVLRFVHIRKNKKLAQADSMALSEEAENDPGRRATGFRYVI